MKMTLLCERCNVRGVKTKVGVFNYDDLTWPLDCSIFKTWNREYLPDPFPAGMVDSWEWARCRTCGARPFLNTIPQADGTVMVVNGERVEAGYEGNVLTAEFGHVPIPDYPGQKLVFIPPQEAEGMVVEQLTQDPPIQKETKNGPVTCPECGKDYKSQANLDRYHNCKGVTNGPTEPNTNERRIPT